MAAHAEELPLPAGAEDAAAASPSLSTFCTATSVATVGVSSASSWQSEPRGSRMVLRRRSYVWEGGWVQPVAAVCVHDKRSLSLRAIG